MHTYMRTYIDKDIYTWR